MINIASVDYSKLKREYLRGNISYRALAEKYGVPFGTLRKVAAKEQWAQLRAQARAKSDTKIIEVVSTKEADKAAKIVDAADQLLDRICAILPMVENPTGLRDLTTALKNLRDIKGIKSDADMREQEARIRNLEKQAEAEQKDSEIKVTIEGDLDLYSK